jgi:hypothetical protein
MKKWNHTKHGEGLMKKDSEQSKITYNLQVLQLSNFSWQKLKTVVTKVQGTQSFCKKDRAATLK